MTRQAVIGISEGIGRVMEQAKRVAHSVCNVLITGESGTGKDLLARTIHKFGKRPDSPFIAINCSAIPENLLESELFGHSKGSFTGATTSRKGLFEEAQGGTLFLDEIGDMNFNLQSKLLRALQEKKIRSVGESIEKNIQVRVISATNQNLTELIAQNKFREDLYYRLNVFPIKIPPLRERRDDISTLAEHFLLKHNLSNNRRTILSQNALRSLEKHYWRGNVRELENVIERSVILNNTDEIENIEFFDDLNTGTPRGDNFYSIDHLMSLDDLIDHYIHFILEKNKNEKEKTYRELKIDRKTLYRKLLPTKNFTNCPK